MLRPKKFVRRFKRDPKSRPWLPRVLGIIRLLSIFLSIALTQIAETQAENPFLLSLIDFFQHLVDATADISH